MKTALIVGAQGALGSVTCTTFIDGGWRAVPAGRRADDRHDFRYVDLDRAETIEAALAGVDIVISTVPHSRRTIERLILERGGLLIGPTDLDDATASELQSLASPRGTVLVNAGLIPGLSNLVAAELVELHPEADEIELAFTASSAGTAGNAAGQFAHRAFTSKRRHASRSIPFPAPLGERHALEYGEGVRGHLGRMAASRTVRSFISYDEPLIDGALRVVNRLGLCSVLPRHLFTHGRDQAVADATREPVAVWVAVLARGERLAAGTIFCRGDYRATAAALLAFADTLTTSATLGAGVLYPTDVLSVEDIRATLAMHAVNIDVPVELSAASAGPRAG